MVDGEWWRVNAPRRAGEDGTGTGAPDGPGESIYLPPPAPAAPPAPPVRPPSVPKQAPPESASRPDWDRVHIDLSVLDEPAEAPAPVTEPEPVPEAEAEAVPVVASKRPGRRKRAAGAVADAPARRGVLAGRRPSPLLLLASVVLVGGALTGMVLVMLVGWALAYLSRRLGDRTKKFAVLGIPLVAMTGLTVWFWGRSQGRWGVALQPGEQVGQQIWGSAPGVLRLAAALSAAFLLVVTMRRGRGE